MFHFSWTVRLADTDAAGVLYFARLLDAAHAAYEAWLAEQGWSIGRILREKDFGLPIVHAEADYQAPILAGDRLDIELRRQAVGTRSFSTHYRMVKPDGQCAAQVRLVHAVVDASGRPGTPPPDLLQALNALEAGPDTPRGD